MFVNFHSWGTASQGTGRRHYASKGTRGEILHAFVTDVTNFRNAGEHTGSPIQSKHIVASLALRERLRMEKNVATFPQQGKLACFYGIAALTVSGRAIARLENQVSQGNTCV